MKIFSEWVKNNQVAAFFSLVFLISWPGLILIFFVFPGNQIVEVLFSQVVYSPALAALYISYISNPKPEYEKSKIRKVAFITAWLASSAVQILYFSFVRRVDLVPGIIIICCIFSLFPAWIISAAYSRYSGIRKHFSTILKPRGPIVWYLVIFLIFPGIPILSYFLTNYLGGNSRFYLAEYSFSGAFLFLMLEFAKGFLMTGGINEESGWRGFALPRLQAQYSILTSAIIVWFFWALWHLPYDIGTGVPVQWIIENRILWCLVFSIIMTWLYNNTKGSILAPALFHPAMNTFGNQFSMDAISQILFIGIAFFAIFHNKMWEKLPSHYPAVINSDTK